LLCILGAAVGVGVIVDIDGSTSPADSVAISVGASMVIVGVAEETNGSPGVDRGPHPVRRKRPATRMPKPICQDSGGNTFLIGLRSITAMLSLVLLCQVVLFSHRRSENGFRLNTPNTTYKSMSNHDTAIDSKRSYVDFLP